MSAQDGVTFSGEGALAAWGQNCNLKLAARDCLAPGLGAMKFRSSSSSSGCCSASSPWRSRRWWAGPPPSAVCARPAFFWCWLRPHSPLPTATGPLPQDGGNSGRPAGLKPLSQLPPPPPQPVLCDLRSNILATTIIAYFQHSDCSQSSISQANMDTKIKDNGHRDLHTTEAKIQS